MFTLDPESRCKFELIKMKKPSENLVVQKCKGK